MLLIGLFTGWDDVPLAVEGVEEAKAAGNLLKLHGFEFDVVYTSWLGRAIETAWYVMDEMDCKSFTVLLVLSLYSNTHNILRSRFVVTYYQELA
jgi:bisphosphoglycerate-dependent phosphoglycerate mutase